MKASLLALLALSSLPVYAQTFTAPVYTASSVAHDLRYIDRSPNVQWYEGLFMGISQSDPKVCGLHGDTIGDAVANVSKELDAWIARNTVVQDVVLTEPQVAQTIAHSLERVYPCKIN